MASSSSGKSEKPPAQTTSSREMVAHFAPGGGWSVVDQTGNVQLHHENESAQAERAHFERMSDTHPAGGIRSAYGRELKNDGSQRNLQSNQQ